MATFFNVVPQIATDESVEEIIIRGAHGNGLSPYKFAAFCAENLPSEESIGGEQHAKAYKSVMASLRTFTHAGTRRRRRRLCVSCIRQGHGTHTVLQDFAVVYCPWHGDVLIRSCQACHAELTWNCRHPARCAACNFDLLLSKTFAPVQHSRIIHDCALLNMSPNELPWNDASAKRSTISPTSEGAQRLCLIQSDILKFPKLLQISNERVRMHGVDTWSAWTHFLEIEDIALYLAYRRRGLRIRCLFEEELKQIFEATGWQYLDRLIAGFILE